MIEDGGSLKILIHPRSSILHPQVLSTILDPPSSILEVLSLSTRQPRIHRIPEPVAQEIKAKKRHEDEQARDKNQERRRKVIR
jgi:hypothetical protein